MYVKRMSNADIQGNDMMQAGGTISIEVVLAAPLIDAGVRTLLSAHSRFVLWPESWPDAMAPQGPDVVVTDVDRFISQPADCWHAPVIVIAPQLVGRDVRAAMERGASGYLIQNCTSVELVDAVLSVASGRTGFSGAIAADLLVQPAGLLTCRERDV